MRKVASFYLSGVSLLTLGLGASASAGNLLSNAGFESGAIAPWVTTNWQVVSDAAHTGTYSAKVWGNYSIYQAFTPTLGSQISEISLWLKQDPAEVSYLSVQYADNSEDFILAYPTNTGFNKYDLTSVLNPFKTAVGFTAYGYSGGQDGPTWIDDVRVESAVPEPATWAALGLGAVAMLRRRRA